jgi:peptidoglycan/LPS O-acetylase OafA/YrhL
MANSNSGALVNLDFVRALAISMVLISHLPISPDLIPEHYDLPRLAH